MNDFCKPGFVIQLGYEPNRIDILTSITGVDWEDVWKNKTRGIFGNSNISVYFIGKKQLIKNKLATGRFVDNLGKIIAVVGPPGGSSGEISLLQKPGKRFQNRSLAAFQARLGFTAAGLLFERLFRNRLTILKNIFLIKLNIILL
ncbi:MAG: hypothetical protein HUU08_17330 [Candidatus Brocadia sp.]|nr:hypothetical protein [Candidatus Brocadia sp.]